MIYGFVALKDLSSQLCVRIFSQEDINAIYKCANDRCNNCLSLEKSVRARHTFLRHSVQALRT